MLKIEKEWRWEAADRDQRGWFREELVWRGIVLASVEGGGERWFGNLGNGITIEDWKSRCAHLRSRADAKAAIVRVLLERLKEGLSDGE